LEPLIDGLLAFTTLRSTVNCRDFGFLHEVCNPNQDEVPGFWHQTKGDSLRHNASLPRKLFESSIHYVRR
jgi:hypothetical protein